MHSPFLTLLQAESGPSGALIFLGVLIIIIILIISFGKKVGEIHSNQVFHFVDLQFSTQDFYKLLIQKINAYGMPDVEFGKVNYRESNIISAKREYLRVWRKDDIFDICAAPFGKGSFVSYWYGEPKKKLKELAQHLPGGNTITEGFDKRTRYEVDTSIMFQTWVKDGIKAAMDDVTENKGIRLTPEAAANIPS